MDPVNNVLDLFYGVGSLCIVIVFTVLVVLYQFAKFSWNCLVYRNVSISRKFAKIWRDCHRKSFVKSDV